MRPVLVVLAAQALASAAAAGTSERILHLNWPRQVNQSATYRPSFKVAGHIRSVTLRYKGIWVPRGFVFDNIVDCAHRGPAFLDWDWAAAGGGYVLLRIDMTAGYCRPGPTVAGTTAQLVLTIRTR